VRIRDILVVAMAIVAATGVAGCAGGADTTTKAAVPSTVDAAALKNVTLRVGDQKGSSIQALLKAAGQLTGLPYQVQFATFTSGPPMLEAANANAIDVGQVGNTPPIFSAAAGGRIDIIGAYRSSAGDAILVPRGSPIHSLADLRGKSIAVAQGSSANGTLLGTLNQAGLQPTDVKLDYLQPSDAYAAFSQGQVDAWAIWEPYVAEAVLANGAQELVSPHDAVNGTGVADGAHLSNGYSFIVAARSSLADPGKNTALADFIVRVAKAQVWAAQHPAQWGPLLAQETGLALPVAQAAAADNKLLPVVVTGSVVQAEQKLADAFATAGQIPGKVDMAAYIDHRFDTAVGQYVATLTAR
jgi:sulfonate transport system substrate-binding protein